MMTARKLKDGYSRLALVGGRFVIITPTGDIWMEAKAPDSCWEAEAATFQSVSPQVQKAMDFLSTHPKADDDTSTCAQVEAAFKAGSLLVRHPIHMTNEVDKAARAYAQEHGVPAPATSHEVIEAAFLAGLKKRDSAIHLHEFSRPEYFTDAARAYAQEHTAPEASAWVSVKDRLPDDGQNVLWYCQGCACPDIFIVGKLGEIKGRISGLNYHHPIRHYTHWQPLPAPPKQEQPK